MLERIFESVLEMSVTASYAIAAVLMVRLLLRRSPRWISCALWSVVLFRLVCPVSFSSAFSLPRFPWAPGAAESPKGALPTLASSSAAQGPAASSVPQAASAVQAAGQGASGGATLPEIASVVWLLGVAAILVYAVASCLAVRGRVGAAVRIRDNIYRSDAYGTPFVFGLFRPRIYLPAGPCGEEKYILLHEKAHIRRGDHILKPAAFLAAAVHWFNPLAWLAFALMARDMEMSCDERVLGQLGSGVKAEYGDALLAMAPRRRSFSAVPLAFGESSTKERVKNVIRYKKSPKWAVALSVALCAAVIAACAANPAQSSGSPDGASGSSSPAESDSPATGDASKYYFNFMQPNTIVIYDENCERTIVQGGELSADEISGRADIAAMGLVGSTKEMRIAPNTKVDYGPRGDFMNIYYKLPGNDFYQLDPTPAASGASSSGSRTGDAPKYYFNFMQPNTIVIYDENCERTIVQGGELSADEISGRADIAAMGLVGSTEEMRIAPNTKVDYGPRGDFMNIYHKLSGNDFYQLDPTSGSSLPSADGDAEIEALLAKIDLERYPHSSDFAIDAFKKHIRSMDAASDKAVLEDDELVYSMLFNEYWGDAYTSSDLYKKKMEANNESARKIISTYADGSAATGASFQELPRDFVFPKSIPDIHFEKNEAGDYLGKLDSADSKYEMWVTIGEQSYGDTQNGVAPRVTGVVLQSIKQQQ